MVRRGVLRTLGVLTCLLALASCGGGGSGTAGGGGLTVNPVWEQPGTGGAEAALPDAVTTARVVFESDAGLQCCIAVTPSSVPVDPASGLRILVLDALPVGPATFTLAGFATDFAPAPAGITSICPTNPPDVGQLCDTERPAAPSFESAPQQVTIVAGTRTQAPTVEVRALPFVIDLYPAPGESVESPLAARFTAVDAVTGIDPNSIVLEASFRSLTKRIPVTLAPCDDATDTACSPQGTLQVSGYRAVGEVRTFPPDLITLRILASNLASPADQLDFSYNFTALTGVTAESAIAALVRSAAGSANNAEPGQSGAAASPPASGSADSGASLLSEWQAQQSTGSVPPTATATPAVRAYRTPTPTPTPTATPPTGPEAEETT